MFGVGLYTIHDYQDQYTLEKNRNINIETLYERLSKCVCWYDYISNGFITLPTQDFIDQHNLDKTRISLFHIHPESQTEECCLAAVKRCGGELTFVVNQTHEICLEAVKQDGWSAIKYVKNKTPDICLAAVKSHPYALQFLNEYEQTEEICLEAVSKAGNMLFYVINKTPKIIKAALAQNPHSIKVVKN
jgi:hypothetical protein